MKKILTALLLLLAVTTTARAQFKQGTYYVGASLTGLNMSYSKNTDFQLGLNADAGYFIIDKLMLHGTLGIDSHPGDAKRFTMGGGARYYFLENGISLGAGLEFSHLSPGIDNLRLPFEVSYTYYLNHHVAIEPAAYYRLSLNDFSGGSEVGVRLGLGFYF